MPSNIKFTPHVKYDGTPIDPTEPYLDTRQYLVVRKNLNMRLGKAAVQLTRACEALLDDFRYSADDSKNEIMHSWRCDGINKRICVYVDDLPSLEALETLAKQQGWLHYGVIDRGLTEFNGVPTYTALVVGPDLSENLIPYFKHLKLA